MLTGIEPVCSKAKVFETSVYNHSTTTSNARGTFVHPNPRAEFKLKLSGVEPKYLGRLPINKRTVSTISDDE